MSNNFTNKNLSTIERNFNGSVELTLDSCDVKTNGNFNAFYHFLKLNNIQTLKLKNTDVELYNTVIEKVVLKDGLVIITLIRHIADRSASLPIQHHLESKINRSLSPNRVEKKETVLRGSSNKQPARGSSVRSLVLEDDNVSLELSNSDVSEEKVIVVRQPSRNVSLALSDSEVGEQKVAVVRGSIKQPSRNVSIALSNSNSSVESLALSNSDVGEQEVVVVRDSNKQLSRSVSNASLALSDSEVGEQEVVVVRGSIKQPSRSVSDASIAFSDVGSITNDEPVVRESIKQPSRSVSRVSRTSSNRLSANGLPTNKPETVVRNDGSMYGEGVNNNPQLKNLLKLVESGCGDNKDAITQAILNLSKN